jgi:hypothetical protein
MKTIYQRKWQLRNCLCYKQFLYLLACILHKLNLNALTLFIMAGLLSATNRWPTINMKPMHFKNTSTCQKTNRPDSMHCHNSKQCCQIDNALITTVNPIISLNITYKTCTMLWLGWLATSLSLQRPRFNPTPVHTAHVDKMAVAQFFSKHSGFSCRYQSIHAHVVTYHRCYIASDVI